MIHLILLVFALVLSIVAAAISGPGFNWNRAIAVALACYFAAALVGAHV